MLDCSLIFPMFLHAFSPLFHRGPSGAPLMIFNQPTLEMTADGPKREEPRLRFGPETAFFLVGLTQQNFLEIHLRAKHGDLPNGLPMDLP